MPADTDARDQLLNIDKKIKQLHNLDPSRRKERAEILSLKLEFIKARELLFIREHLSDHNDTLHEVWGQLDQIDTRLSDLSQTIGNL